MATTDGESLPQKGQTFEHKSYKHRVQVKTVEWGRKRLAPSNSPEIPLRVKVRDQQGRTKDISMDEFRSRFTRVKNQRGN